MSKKIAKIAGLSLGLGLAAWILGIPGREACVLFLILLIWD
jgi:hypothetical protein